VRLKNGRLSRCRNLMAAAGWLSGNPAAGGQQPYSPRRGPALEATLQRARQPGRPAHTGSDKIQASQTGHKRRSHPAGPCRWPTRRRGRLRETLAQGQQQATQVIRLTATVSQQQGRRASKIQGGSAADPRSVGARRRDPAKITLKPIPAIEKTINASRHHQGQRKTPATAHVRAPDRPSSPVA